MRIAIISSLFPPYDIGGAERIAAQLARALCAAGHDVHVITTCRRDELGGARFRSEECESVRVWRIAPWNLYWGFDRQSQHPGWLARAGWHAVDLWNPSVIRPLREVLDRVRPDVIHTHNIDGFSPVVWQVARSYTGAIVHTLHDCHLMCPRATMQRRDGAICERLCRLCSVYNRYHRSFQHNVRVLVAPASAIAETHRGAGWTQPRFEIVSNGVNVGPIHVPRIPDSDPLRVLFLSRLEREKGCETLLAAVPEVGQPASIEIHIAGRGGYENRFEELARRVPSVVWHGFLSGAEKHEVLSQSDVFLQLSECRENAPLSLLEAKAYGLYLVATDVGGIPEQIQRAGAGRLIPPARPEALVKALQELAGVKQALRDGRSARLRRAAGYGTREMVEAYLRIYESLTRLQ